VITLACIQCYLALRTSGEFDEVDYLIGTRCDWYPDRYPCPRSGCNGKMTLTDVIDSKILPLLEVHELNPQECFQAFNGLGLPKERSCSEVDVLRVMGNKKIKFIDMRNVNNTTRVIIHSIVLEDGCRIYFGSSPQGAMVYRIAPPRSVVQEVLDGQS